MENTHTQKGYFFILLKHNPLWFYDNLSLITRTRNQMTFEQARETSKWKNRFYMSSGCYRVGLDFSQDSRGPFLVQSTTCCPLVMHYPIVVDFKRSRCTGKPLTLLHCLFKPTTVQPVSHSPKAAIKPVLFHWRCLRGGQGTFSTSEHQSKIRSLQGVTTTLTMPALPWQPATTQENALLTLRVIFGRLLMEIYHIPFQAVR